MALLALMLFMGKLTFGRVQVQRLSQGASLDNYYQKIR